MAEKRITCIICPQGCDIAVAGDGDHIHSMAGQGCKRGEIYARDEYMHPLRILTSTVKVTDGTAALVAVRTDKPIAKELLFKGMEEIRKVQTAAPVKRGDIIISNILDTGANLVATGEASASL
jgi:CxxC motif-containing protein